MKGYVIELHATFAFKADSEEEAIQKIYENIDLNETPFEKETIEEMSCEEFNRRFGD